ncbi:MAG TPA: hypothetical protein VGG68_15575, partial [Caulobacteraceae bacterium]
MVGPIVLPGNPTAALQAAPRQYVDGFRNRNKIINGGMVIDQRNAGASGTANGYTVDRWQYTSTQTGKITWGQGSGTIAGFGTTT